MPSELYKSTFLNTMASLVLVVGSLYWARAVLVPLALALMLTFLLRPIVEVLYRQGLGRTPAAVLVVVLVALGLGAGSWTVVTQLSSLAYELPRYKGNLKQKIRDLQHASQGGVWGRVHDT